MIDNAGTHHNDKLEALCETANVSLTCIPAESPGYDPTKASFAMLKAWIRKNMALAPTYTVEIGVFCQFLYEVVEAEQD